MAAVPRRLGPPLALVALLGVVAAVVVVLAVDGDPATPPAPDAAPPSGPTYVNPVVAGESRNPAVLRAADGAHYAYVDGSGPEEVTAYRSTDLVTWTPVGDVLGRIGAWALVLPGARVTTPSVRYVPDAPPAARYVMYLTGLAADGPRACIGVATAADPAGPFVGADAPLVCPPAGAWAASPVPGADQIVYRADEPTPGVHALDLTAAGTAVAPGAAPALLLPVEDGILRRRVLERPAVARDGDRAYLFVRSGIEHGVGVGWSPCLTDGARITSCTARLRLGTWLEGDGDEVGEIGGLQVFTDGDGASWIAYDARPCAGETCTEPSNLRIDKLCFAHEEPRTNGPSTGPQPRDRPSHCSTDVPGADLAVAAVDATEVVTQPEDVSLREVGSTVPLAGRLLWLFRDTYVDTREFDDGPCTEEGASRSSSAGLGVPHPLAGARGYLGSLATFGPDGMCTGPFLPLTEDEIDLTDAGFDAGERVVLWADGGVPLADGSALVFFSTGIQDRDADGEDGPDGGCRQCTPGDLQQGVVRVRPGEAVADRLSTAVGCLVRCLFEPSAAWSGRPFVADGYVYAYSDTPATKDVTVRLGRVPLAQVEDRSAWTFRTAEGEWVPDIGRAAAVPGFVAAPRAVAYNGYLDRYVTVVAPTGGDEVFVQTAPEPWGPWSEATQIDDWSAAACPDVDNGDAVLVPWLDDAGGRVMHFAFTRDGPTFGLDPACPGQVRLVTVELE
jgi:hypothetical protein